eukprot:379865-Rhodomonas_salina.1
MPVRLRRWPGVEVSAPEERSTSMRERYVLCRAWPAMMHARMPSPGVLGDGAKDAHDEAMAADRMSWEFVGEKLSCAVVLHVVCWRLCPRASGGFDDDDAIGDEVCNRLRAVLPELVDSEGGVGCDDLYLVSCLGAAEGRGDALDQRGSDVVVHAVVGFFDFRAVHHAVPQRVCAFPAESTFRAGGVVVVTRDDSRGGQAEAAGL